MNKTIKRFKKLLEQEYLRCRKEISKEAEVYLKENIGSYFNEALAMISNGEITEFEQVDKAAYNMALDMHLKFVDERVKNHPEISDIKYLLNVLEDETYFYEFDMALKYLNNFGFSESEKIEVYAYYFNSTIKFISSYDPSEHESDIARFVKENVEDEKISIKFLNVLLSKKLKKGVLEHLQTRRVNWQHFRNVISEDGTIIPFQYATDLLWILEDMFENQSFVELILKESETKWQQIENEKIKKQEEEKAKKERAYLKAQELSQHLKTQKVNYGLKRNALIRLKEYLNEDMPIKYINEEELQLILELLQIAGYSVHKIKVIEIAIKENNQKIDEQEQILILRKMQQLYLSIEQLEVLMHADRVVNDPDAIKNPLFFQVSDEYSFVLELLLSLNDNQKDNTETLELLTISLEDLKTHLNSYSYTDYRRILKQE